MIEVARYADIKFNDIANGPGIRVSVFVQGCHFHCKDCFNQSTWDFNGGKEFTEETMNSIISGLTKNGVTRNLSILGGEPLCPENTFLTLHIIKTVKEKLPDTNIYIWTGYTIEKLKKENRSEVNEIFSMIDYLIDGPYIDKKRDITLYLRGSSNQRIIKMR